LKRVTSSLLKSSIVFTARVLPVAFSIMYMTKRDSMSILVVMERSPSKTMVGGLSAKTLILKPVRDVKRSLMPCITDSSWPVPMSSLNDAARSFTYLARSCPCSSPISPV